MGDSEIGDRCSSPTESINLNEELSNKNKSIEDDRINCSNSHYLDKIYEVAVRHVTELAESQLNEGKQQFVTRFSETFKNIIEQNVSIKGLPWIINEEKLTTDKKEEQTQETIDALLSKLSKTLEKTAVKRKYNPRECTRVYNMLLKHERTNLKRAKLDNPITLPTASLSPRISHDFPSEDIIAVCENIGIAKQQLEKQEENLSMIQKRIEFANTVAEQHHAHSETLYDTGYISD